MSARAMMIAFKKVDRDGDVAGVEADVCGPQRGIALSRLPDTPHG
jgi:hypothetical protein